ncbi:hypothetical protein CRD60_01480 [Bifidobacterium aemilianum]|uniref:Uncharacterized protein n=1 Tax=Bifidobacterium aemilianum TaxID=2493120 RepID=A0A366KBC7_9BIFI|nr:hypothetical protein [Bifidobacterium aemilianum]RBP98552.1 hypothetical protein CRD60_01480 [Bifidobacterium aemilianum]
MALTARSVRSSSAPAGRRKVHETAQAAAGRPQLRVISGKGSQDKPMAGGWDRLVTWTKSRTIPLIHVVVAVIFLLSTLVTSLVLRTVMVQSSFEESQLESSIANLKQDLLDDEATLDGLQASLPDKAQQMGMVPQQGSISIDLNGYQAPSGGQQ